MLLFRIVRHELAALAADRTLWIALAVFGVLTGYAVLNGTRWADAHTAEIEAVLAEEGERFGVMQMRLIRIEGGRALPGPPDQDPTRAGTVGRSLGERNAVLPPAPLAPLSIGQADILPSVVPVSTDARYGLPGRQEIANPLHLMTGRFDPAFVVLFLLPLLVLALSYDMLSREREGGTLALLLSQPVKLRTVLLGKGLARAAVVLGTVFLFTTAGLAVSGTLWSPAVVLPFALWAATVTVYTAFWLALAALVNLLGRSSAGQAVILAAVWLLFAVVVPSALTAGARIAHPVPSRAEMIGAEREAGRLAQGEGSGLLARYLEDHPELVPGGEAELDEFLAVSHAVRAEVDRRMEPVRRHYDERTQEQRELLERLRFLSPLLLAQGSLDDVAGTGDRRHLDFREQVEAFREEFHAHFDPLVRDQVRFTSRDVGQVPQWRYREEPRSTLLRRLAVALAGIFLPTALLAAVAHRALARFTPSA